jgi:rare lipoprotein A (peptidoglycan hydrolase)
MILLGGMVLGGDFRADFCPIIQRIVAMMMFGWLGTTGSAQADPRIDQDTAAALRVASHPALVEQEGVASWYGRHWRGRRTASGRVFDERRFTAASLTLPLNCRARVMNLQNGRSVDVLVNDRGPYVAGRVMDLSQRAAAVLGMNRTGLAPVAIVALLRPPSPVKWQLHARPIRHAYRGRRYRAAISS